VLVDADRSERFADRERVAGGDRTRHPEFEIAHCAAAHLRPAERAESTVYTSGEHCPMYAAAHAWVGLGRIVCACSSAQLSAWQHERGLPAGPIAPLPIRDDARGIEVAGRDDELSAQVMALHAHRHGLG
jgi:tRNA(Arg) A34 adenosine deaminase TadA